MSNSDPSIDKILKQNEQLTEENISLREQLDAIKKNASKRKSGAINTTIKGIRIFAGADLRKSFDRVYDELPQVTKPAFAQLSASIIKRITRIGFFSILFAIIPATILLVQTIILIQQNTKLQAQNEQIQQQVYLEEASRRNNLVFLMDSTLDQINDEVKAGNRSLSDPLVGRIKSLMYGFRPYRFLENDALTEPLSVEKGQFLLALLNSGISKSGIAKIFQESFGNIYLKEANLFGQDLSNIDMPDAYLKGADLSQVSFKGAFLQGTSFNNALMARTNLEYADLRNANLSNTNLSNTKLNAAYLENANFEGANLTGASLKEAHVAQKDWFKQLKKWGVIGIEGIETKYKIEGPQKNEFDEEFFIIKSKQ